MARLCAVLSAALAAWGLRGTPLTPPYPALNMAVLALIIRRGPALAKRSRLHLAALLDGGAGEDRRARAVARPGQDASGQALHLQRQLRALSTEYPGANTTTKTLQARLFNCSVTNAL
jgi:hypothetical protein